MNTIANIQNFSASQASQVSGPSSDQEEIEAEAELIALAQFNERANLEHAMSHAHAHKSIAHRRIRPSVKKNAKNDPSKANKSDSHDDSDLQSAIADAIDSLSKNGETYLEGKLTQEYDVLERNTLLRSARDHIDDTDLSDDDKAKLKDSLDNMLSKLMNEHGDEIKQGLQDATSLEMALDSMNQLAAANTDNYDSNTLSDLRNAFGAKGDNKLDEPLTPFELAKSLQEKFGAGNFNEALGSLRSKMASDLRGNNAASSGPRIWLSLSDASSFNIVQSSYSIAGDLRRALSEQAGITPQADQADTMVVLLGVTLPGAGKAAKMVAQIASQRDLKTPQQTRAYSIFRQAVSKLPITLWDPKKLSQRMTFLDELNGLIFGKEKKSETSRDSEEKIEEKLRDQLGLSRKPRREGEQEDDRSNRDDEDDEGDENKNGKKEGVWKNY